MELAKYKACICEGAAENTIMDILLDEELLVFSREEMLEESVIRCRDGKKFEQKIDVINVITAPEIEMLIIFAENQYKEFKKSGKKPSDFCEENLRMSDVKYNDVGVKTINKFNPIPYSTLKNSYFVVYRRGLGNI